MPSRLRVFVALLIVALLVTGTFAALIWLVPVPLSNKRVFVDFLLGRGIDTPAPDVITERLAVPEGFELSLYAGDIPLARWLLFSSSGELLVSRSRAGEVLLLERDADGDGRADARRVLLSGLDRPHGLAIRDGWLWVAETTAVGRVRFDESSGQISGSYEHVITGLSGDGFHLTRSIGFGPDGGLYLSQGSSCNVCIEKDERRATIMRFEPDGSNGVIYATGLRNSVGFDWAPWDGALYATENGRDLLGDDFPPDELNRIEAGGFYGWPYVNGFGVPDPEFGASAPALAVTAKPPQHAFRAHNAPLGISFIKQSTPPPGYERAALVALHGSWNRTSPDGYKVVSLHWTQDGSIEERDFLSGFLGTGAVIGRPSDVAEGPDGAFYVADDYAGAVYRISYRR
jgi:glucose/arabinose dehydrogenase